MRWPRALTLLFGALIGDSIGILFPQRNEVRQFDLLDGLWTFVREPFNSDGVGIANQWFTKDLSVFENATVMPVPCAYNELSTDRRHREHLGWVWYQTRFRVSKNERHFQSVLRFGSVQYFAQVYLNGELLGEHEGGHLPFELPIEPMFHRENVLTVAVNNTLSHATVPQGDVTRVHTFDYEGVSVTPTFDFFNYAGILRSVHVLQLPLIFVHDLTLFADAEGNIKYSVELNARLMPEYEVEVLVYKKGDSPTQTIYRATGTDGSARIETDKFELWWPRGYGKPTLYTFEVRVGNVPKQKAVDVYRETFGFRTVSVSKDKIYVNGHEFYCRGFGMHEDFNLFGRGFSPVVMTKDLNMLEWMNGNCYRTSHYPYSEERAYEADRRGIMVIAETPAVALQSFSNHTLKLHRQMVEELFKRDHRHPSVFMWSLANEPASYKKESRTYFKSLVQQMHALDRSRPVTIVFSASVSSDQAADLVDLICVNRYYGWYINHGHLESINGSLVGDIRAWRSKFGKPVILSEYGADTLEAMTAEPSVAFTVQYQVELLARTHDAIDVLRKENALTGEMIWNFADFMTAQTTTRVVGNHKGVLTRDRQPKMAAYLLKNRYARLEGY